jgi:hypothetical protein
MTNPVGLGAGPDLTVGAVGMPGLITVVPPDMTGVNHVLRVGVGQQFTTISSAVAASQDGDLILVNAGTYTNDFATITHKITIQGVGGMANLVATVPPSNSKGIFTVDNDVTIKNMSFSGAWITEDLGANAAGIRYEGGQLVLINDVFTGNQNGIMGSPSISGLTVNTVTIDQSVFSGNGGGTGNTHNLYIGSVDKLTVTNSIFQNAVVGHELKSRALVSNIQNNYFSDGPSGTASYDIDLPNGGVALVKNNTIEKGPSATQGNMVHFGGEGIPYAGSSLTVTGNTFVNDRGDSTVGVLNQTAINVDITSNRFVGIPAEHIASGPATETSNTDGNGVGYPDSTLVGVLPGNTLVITDALDHTVALGDKLLAVQGGSGHLTVSAVAGHVIAMGGSGGMDFSEVEGSGGNQIVTKAGSLNHISVVGQDSIDSEGTDTIVTKLGNITGQVGGIATISDGLANNQWSVLGTAIITGHGGAPVVNVGAHGNLTMNGTVGYLEVQNNGGIAKIDVVQGGLQNTLSVTGGAMDVKIYGGQMTVVTAGSAQGSTLRFGAGTVTLSSFGNDMIYAGSGSETIIVSGKATVYAGTGTMALYNHGISGATFYGNGGRYLIAGDGGGVTYYGGVLASTIDAQLSATLIGGAGRLTVNGGSRDTITGGAGGLTYVASGGGANTITTQAGSVNQLTMDAANTVYSWGQDTISLGTGNQNIMTYGKSVVNGGTGNSKIALGGTGSLTFVGGSGSALIESTGSSLHLTGGSGVMTASGGSMATDFTAGTGTTTLTMNTAGGHVVFGQGATTVQVADSGAGVLFDFAAGSGGGINIIKGFRAGTDRLELLGGIGVKTEIIAGGAANLVLTDNTQVSLVGVTSTTQLFQQLPQATDTLVLGVSEDAWQGDAQYTVSVDGQQAGGVYTATASHAAGQVNLQTINGSWGKGAHTVGINFINDAYGGSVTTDRNLYVSSANFDGSPVAMNPIAQMSAGTAAIAIPASSIPATPATDTLVLGVSEDAWQGDAQYTVSVDGQQAGGVYTATASHATGQVSLETINGSWGKGAHTVGISFINDAYGGSATTDRNLYVSSANFDGSPVAMTPIAQMSAGTAAIAIPATSNPGILTIHMAEDAFQGDAQFTLAINGTQVGGSHAVTAINGKATQAFSFADTLTATQDIAVSFTNDLYNPLSSPPGDRNLYVAGADFNGVALNPAIWTANMFSNGTSHFSLQVP